MLLIYVILSDSFFLISVCQSRKHTPAYLQLFLEIYRNKLLKLIKIDSNNNGTFHA